MTCYCGKELTGKQRKYCCVKCQMKDRKYVGHNFIRKSGQVSIYKQKPENTILDDKTVPVPERELWSAVILQAMINVHFLNYRFEDDLRFLQGNGNFKWICEHLGLDEKILLKRAQIAAINMPDNFRIHNNDSKGEKG
jgi:hypothetical protein